MGGILLGTLGGGGGSVDVFHRVEFPRSDISLNPPTLLPIMVHIPWRFSNHRHYSFLHAPLS